MSKNFSELRFPEDISYNSLGNIYYSTDIVESNNLKESRNINWTESRIKYDLSYSIRSWEQLKKLTDFFRLHKGRAIGFRFKDWCDFEVKKQHIATFRKDKFSYQLFKVYQIQDLREFRMINKVVANTLKIYDEKGKDLEHEVSINQGTVKLLEYPKEGEKIFADFEFDVAARFDNDQLTYNMDNYNTYSCPNLTIIEIKIR